MNENCRGIVYVKIQAQKLEALLLIRILNTSYQVDEIID